MMMKKRLSSSKLISPGSPGFFIMTLPLFYSISPAVTNGVLPLNEDTSRHCIQVLRMKAGEQLQVIDGAGKILTVELTVEHKKSAMARVVKTEYRPAVGPEMTIAISLVKNASRFEWFLEKATELGITRIVPLLCERTEKHHFRADRMQNILVSAMLQSHQVWLPQLQEPMAFPKAVEGLNPGQKFIAHCLQEERRSLSSAIDKQQPGVVMIGPEGDFTKKEIDAAIGAGYQPVLLGETRLRTETAGVTAAVIMKVN